ncbi:MAG: hypothetical protein P8127_16190 [Acidobacteriota bacterium]|jgi:hypothetical protein
MVEMTVGVEHHFRLQARHGDPMDDSLRLFTGIDDGELTGIAISEQHAVSLDRTDWKHFEKK